MIYFVVIISSTNPDRERILAELDSDFKRIKETVVWFEIIRRHLATHRARTRGWV